MTALADEVVEQAIAWRVRLASGEASAEDVQGCLHWRDYAPQHEQAWQRLESLGQRFAGVPTQLGQATLRQPAVDLARRRALKHLAWFGTSSGILLLGQQWQPWQPLLAEQRTAVGEQRRVSLPDGAILHLNSATALDIDYSAESHLIRLYRGELLLSSLASTQPGSWLLSTEQGVLQAQQARLLLRDNGASCLLEVYAGKVQVRPRAAPSQWVEAGQQVKFDAKGATVQGAADELRSSWVDGVLVAQQMPLAQFVDELGRQRNGVLRCDPAVAALRISGVFPLADSDRVLRALSQTLPVKVVYRSRYWVTVLPA
ncbi:FecR domain-containing protein [Pseudomonas sp.]|jgi:transmembrane sensor|uniref:FecR domain-containing protein n=1 Tax=Pseudomonas sp. TaxID=306 RepID=UPI0037C5DC40